ncbi:FG-GAP-like repeat-containing protein [Desulfothermus sp.]
MRKFVILFIMFFLCNIAYSAQLKKFSVLSFKVNGPDEFRYLSQGVQSMLISRLSTPSKLEYVKVEHSSKTPIKVIQENELDYLIFGDVTVVGTNISIDINVLNKNGKSFSQNISAPQDELLSRFDEGVILIKNRMLGIKPKPRKTQNVSESAPETQKLNPSFEYAKSPGTHNMGYIRTQSLPFEMVGMDVGDANGDNKNEVFILSHHKIYAYILIKGKLKKIGEQGFGRNINGLNINVFDSNRDGYAEIFISAIDNEGSPSSLVMTFKNNKFRIKQERLKFYLNVKRIPPDFTKRIVAQKAGIGRIFAPGVHELVSMRGKYQLGAKIKLPEGANVFNFAYLPEKKSYKIILAGYYDRLKVFSDDLNPLYKTNTRYAGSSIGIITSNALPGLGENVTDPKNMYYIPTRLIPYDLERNGQFEIIVAHNMSVSSMFFSRYREFPEGQIHALVWDGVGLNILWKTRTIKGSIMDYGINDIDNDSKKELYVGINTHPGPVGFRKKRTIILIYELNLKK